MLKRDMTYEDWNGEKVTETFYFNISKPELMELDVEYDEGMGEMIKKIIETEDRKKLLENFKRIVLLSHGVKSDDGKRFIKNEQTREEFSQTAAYVELFMELSSDAEKAAEFLKHVLPRDLVEQNQDKLLVPPTAPTPTA